MNKKDKIEVAVLLLVMNESPGIVSSMATALKKNYSVFIISPKQEFKELASRLKCNFIKDEGKGKGEAIRKALPMINAGYIVFLDTDGSHIISDVPLLIEKLKEGNDLAIASRLIGGSEELYDGTFDSFLRSVFTLTINQIVNMRFNSRITDTQNGFRAFRASALKSLNLKSKCFEIETEEVMQMLKKGYKIAEIPSREIKRRFGTSHLSMLKHGWRYPFIILQNLF